MKPITRLRKFKNRGDRHYPMASLAFYGPDDRKASKAVLGIQPNRDADIELHKWVRDSPEADLRYDVKLQNTWIEIIHREGVRSLAMMEEIFGCPHEEGIDYPVGEVCSECPFWADRPPIEPKPVTRVYTAIASYKPEQWQDSGNRGRSRQLGENLGGVECPDRTLNAENARPRYALPPRGAGCRRNQPILQRTRRSE